MKEEKRREEKQDDEVEMTARSRREEPSNEEVIRKERPTSISRKERWGQAKSKHRAAGSSDW